MTIDKAKLKALAQKVADLEDQPELEGEHREAYDELWLYMHCHTILDLLAEIDRLKTLRSTTERDLAQELEVWRYGPSCWNCGDTGDVHDMVGEWLGQCDCNAAKLIDACSERDQLKAEVEALRQDAERYRWLCSQGEGCPSYPFVVINDFDSTKQDIDSAIDACMK